MKLTPCNEMVRTRCYAKSENLLLLEQYISCGAKCCEVEGYHHKSAVSACSSLINSAKHFGYHNIGAAIRGDKVYLFLKEEK